MIERDAAAIVERTRGRKRQRVKAVAAAAVAGMLGVVLLAGVAVGQNSSGTAPAAAAGPSAAAPAIEGSSKPAATADEAQAQAEAARSEAEQAGAKAAAEAQWGFAEERSKAAKTALEGGDSARAITLWQEATDAYRKARTLAGGAETDRLLRLARTNAASPDTAMAARETLAKLLALDPNNEAAQALAKKVDDTLFTTNSFHMRLVRLPPGKFMMGTPEGQTGRGRSEIQHSVTLTRAFWISTTEVTQAQFEAVMEVNPSLVKGADLPVTNVTYARAAAFCEKLGQKEGKRYRLPTEAEWEYACRAGSSEPFSGGGKLDELGWYVRNSERHTHPVGKKKPNAWGLYDMHGNVDEWCKDLLPRYTDDALTDPMGPELNNRGKPVSDSALRGGSIRDDTSNCRSAARQSRNRNTEQPSIGFRVVMEVR